MEESGEPRVCQQSLWAAFLVWRLLQGRLWLGPGWLCPDQPPRVRSGVGCLGQATPTLAVGWDVWSRN